MPSPRLFVQIGIQTTDRPNQRAPLYLSGRFNELECLGGGRVLISRRGDSRIPKPTNVTIENRFLFNFNRINLL